MRCAAGAGQWDARHGLSRQVVASAITRLTTPNGAAVATLVRARRGDQWLCRLATSAAPASETSPPITPSVLGSLSTQSTDITIVMAGSA